MGIFDVFSRQKAVTSLETRANIENQSVPVSSENFLAFFGIQTANLPNINVDNALTVPAVWAAVAFMSRTMATLPLHAYRKTKDGPQKLSGKIETVVHEAPNDGQGSFKFWQWFWQQVFTGGRGLAYIERTPQGVESLWPMDPMRTTVKFFNGVLTYQYSPYSDQQGIKEYAAADVVDVPFMLRSNGYMHYGPIMMASKAIQLAIAMNDYGSNFFAGGGVPPLALQGPLPAGDAAMKRAQADIKRSVDAAKSANEPVFPIPAGYTLNPVGLDPAKGQMVEARRFQVEEIARAFQLPPVFLQDLSHGTFSNVEQQDLHLVKHLIGQWAQALEDELNLKLFGRGNGGRFVQYNLDGLMRGDFVSRMTGYGQAIQNGIRTPDEVRTLENLPLKGDAADKLYIQGATVPLGTQAVAAAAPAKPANDNTNKTDGAKAA